MAKKKKKRGKGEETKRQKQKATLENEFFLEQEKNQQRRGPSRKGSP